MLGIPARRGVARVTLPYPEGIKDKFKMKNFVLLLLLFIAACRLPDNFGFFQPYTLSLKVPDGTPEFKAGWYAGCKSGLANRGLGTFANAFVYGEGHGPDFGSGIYQHDPVYQTAWGNAFYACRIHIQNFVGYNAMRDGPLQ